MNSTQAQSQPGKPKSGGTLKLTLLVTVVLLAGFLYTQYGSSLSLDNLAAKEDQLRTYQEANAIKGALLSFLVYVAVTGLSLPGAAVLTLGLGWLLGFGKGLLVVSFASTAGATLAFLFSRFLLRDSMMNRFGDRLQTFNAALEREGPFYLFSLRLIPVIPFFVINLVMGLTPIRTTTFWWISQLGMLPATAVYVYAGSTFPSLGELAEKGITGILQPELIIAFAILGIFPLIIKKLLNRAKPQTAAS